MPPRAFPQLPAGQYMTPVSNNANTQILQPAPSRRASVPVVTTPDVIKQEHASPSDNVKSEDTGSPSKPNSAPASALLPQASLAVQGQAQPSMQQNMQNWQHTPFSMALPLESQQMMNPSTVPQNAFGNALMSHPSHADFDLNSFGFDDFGPSDPGSMLKPGANFYANQSGMNMTLAPDQMLKSNAASSSMSGQNMQAFDGAALTPGHDMNNLFNFDSNMPSAAGTPGVNNNDSFDYYNWGDSTT